MKTLYNSINESLFGSRGRDSFIDTCIALAEAAQQNNQKWQKLCRILDIDPENWKYRNLIQFIMISFMEAADKDQPEYSQELINQLRKEKWDPVELAARNARFIFALLSKALIQWNNQKRSGRIELDDLTQFMKDDMLVTVLVKWREL